jgi:hypothetical protein
MGHLTPLIASTSVRGWIALLVILGLLFLDYWATLRIITQAGYSYLWILLPLAPLVLTIVCYVILWNDLHGIFVSDNFGFGGINNASLFWHLDEVSIFLNWLFYLVFAFSRWPVTGTPRAPDAAAPLTPDSTRSVPRSPSSRPAPSAPIPSARVVSSAAGPGAGPASTADPPPSRRPAALACAWCGESLPGSRSLFHDCGPKDRPVTFCKNCGTALPPGSTECNSCSAA